MHLAIEHTTRYQFAEPVAYALQRLRLLPKERQRVARTTVVLVLCLVGQFVGAVFEALDYSRFAVMIHEFFVIGSGMAVLMSISLHTGTRRHARA